MVSLRFSKKAGEEGFTLLQVIGIVIAVIVVLGLALPFLLKIYNLFLKKPDQGTLTSFKELADAIASVKDGDPSIRVSYYIANGFKVVGINQDENHIKQYCGGTNPAVQRPYKCGDQACLVLCDENKGGCGDNGLKDFKTYPQIKSFIADELDLNQGDKKINDNSGKLYNFVLYGLCFMQEHGVRSIYIKRVGNDIILSSYEKTPGQIAQERANEVKSMLLNVLSLQYETVTFKESLGYICDDSNGIFGRFPDASMGYYYEPKNNNCIAGYTFAYKFDNAVQTFSGNKPRNIWLQVSKKGKNIIDYDEHKSTATYSSVEQIGDIKVSLSVYYSP